MRSVSPFSGRLIEGTLESGARSETEDCVLCRPGLALIRGGEEERIPVVEVGTGVGYFWKAASRSEGEKRACLLSGRGNPGEEDSGSNAGSSVGAGRFTPAVEGRLGWALILLGEESIMADMYQSLFQQKKTFQRDIRPRLDATDTTIDTGGIVCCSMYYEK